MRCGSCGTDNANEARFCMGCGAALSPSAAHATALRVLPVPTLCPHCGAPSQPESYFARGVNIAKLVALLPFSIFPPLVFFLLRRERLICSTCHGLLPEGTKALAAAGALTEPHAIERALAQAATDRDLRRLRRKARRRRRWGWTLGLASLGTAGMALGDAPAVLFGFSGLLAFGSVLSLVQGQALDDRVREAERRHRSLQILDLAMRHGGRLNVSLVANRLTLELKEAEAALDGMVDGRRVDVQADEEGRIWYLFPELRALPDGRGPGGGTG